MNGGRPRFVRPDLPLAALLLSLAVGHALVPDQPSPTTQGTNITPEPDLDLDRQLTWSRAAFRYISSVSCKRATFTTGKECQRLTKVDLNQTNVYLALPSSRGGKMTPVFPDSGAQRDPERHDGVMAVDPYPEANFGHLVIVFYIDLDLERTECEKEGGGVWIEGQLLKGRYFRIGESYFVYLLLVTFILFIYLLTFLSTIYYESPTKFFCTFSIILRPPKINIAPGVAAPAPHATPLIVILK